MMGKKDLLGRDQFQMITLNSLVPQNHIVRKIDTAVDLSFIYDIVKDLYSEVGKESIDPVVLIIITLIQYTFGIRSMRQTINEIQTNVAYRWSLGWYPHKSQCK
ncbi:MAG: transposase [Clostridiales bacterium]|uniref:transposase n=1 Tax=Aminipila sp. TaxID=2060095 RepID=UPI001D7358CF|nr:transposase [Aminipila sp.]MBE6033381.1 transposase [Clostridiales bacterium]